MVERTAEEIAEWYSRLNALSAIKREDVNRSKAQAIAYVWGIQDGSGDGSDTAESIAFGDVYGWHALEFAEERGCSQHNIRDAYKSWKATGVIARS